MVDLHPSTHDYQMQQEEIVRKIDFNRVNLDFDGGTISYIPCLRVAPSRSRLRPLVCLLGGHTGSPLANVLL